MTPAAFAAIAAGFALLLIVNNAPKTDASTWKDWVGAVAFLIGLPTVVILVAMALDGGLPSWPFLVWGFLAICGICNFIKELRS